MTHPSTPRPLNSFECDRVRDYSAQLRLAGCGWVALVASNFAPAAAQSPSLGEVQVVFSLSHSGSARGIAFSSDGQGLVSIGPEGGIVRWDLSTYLGAWRKELPGDGLALAVSPRDNSVFASSLRGGGRWSWLGRELTAPALYPGSRLGDAEELLDAEFTRDGAYLAGFGFISPGADSGLLQLWETKGFTRVQADLLTVPDPIYGLFAIDNLRSVAYYGANGGVEAWPFPNHTGEVHGVPPGHGEVNGLAVSPDGRFLAIGGNPGRVYALPDLEQYSVLPWEPITEGVRRSVRSLHFSDDGQRLAAATSGSDGQGNTHGNVMVWEHAGGTDFDLLGTWKAHPSSVGAVRLNPKGDLCVSAHADASFAMWKVKDGTLIKRWGNMTRPLWNMAADPMRPGVFACMGPLVRRLDLVNGTLGEPGLDLGGGLIGTVAVSPSGALIAGSGNRELTVYRRRGHRIVFQTTGKQGWYSDVEFLDERRVAAINFDMFFVWDIESGEVLLRRKCYLRDFALSADRTLLALGDGAVYNASTLERLKRNEPPKQGYVNAVAVSRAGAVAYGGTGFGGTGEALLVPGGDGAPISLSGHKGWIYALEFSLDGKLLASGGSDGVVYLRETALGEIVRRIPIGSSIRSLAVTSDGARLAVGTDSGVLWLLDLPSGEKVVQVTAMGERDFATITPEGFYRASRGILADVGFFLGGKTYSFEQFDLYYNRPDAIVERLGYAKPTIVARYGKAREKRLEKMGLAEGSLLGKAEVPTASFLEVPPAQSASRELSLKIGALDESQAIHSLHIAINGVPLHGESGLSVSVPTGTPYKGSHSVELGDGQNIVQVSVRNASGIESLRHTAEVFYSGPPAKRSLLALVVGISDYDKDEYDLQYAAKDARDLARSLELAGESFDHVEVRRLLDRDVNSASLAQAREMFAAGHPDDLAVVFVAGHGLLDSDLNYYLASSATDFANPAVDGIPYESIEGLLSGIPPRKKLLLMDTCFSGETDISLAPQAPVDTLPNLVSARGLSIVERERAPIVSTDAFALMKELFADLRRGSGAIVISSAGGQEFAFEADEWNNGAFTYAVLEALDRRLADENGDGVISVRELRAYVGSRVQELTAGQQHPTTRQDNLRTDFVLY